MPPLSFRGPATRAPVSGSYTPPIALTAAIAPTTTPSPRSTLAVPMPPLTARSIPSVFATVAPVPAPALPSSTHAVGRIEARGIPVFRAGMDSVLGDADVEQDRRRHDRHRDRPGAVPDVALSQEPDRPGRRIQPESTPAAQDYGLHLRDVAGRPQQVRLPRPRRRTANIHTPNRPAPAQHHSTPGPAIKVSRMADLDPTHVRNAAVVIQEQTSQSRYRLGCAHHSRRLALAKGTDFGTMTRCVPRCAGYSCMSGKETCLTGYCVSTSQEISGT